VPRIPLANVRGHDGREVTVETTPTGWYLRAAAGLRAEVRGFRDGIACRLAPGADTEVVQLGCGAVSSALCNAIYSPSADTALVFSADGLLIEAHPKGRAGTAFVVSCAGPMTITVVENYMRLHRGLPWYRAMNRRHFPRPPAGWCSWYYYYLSINEEEVMRNTDWLAENLRRFGCEWVQIDDGWQGRGEGYGTNRDWFVTCERDFPRGMKFCADYIRRKGMRPGLWCIPFTQSNEQMWREKPELFVHREDGGSPGELSEPLPYEWMPEQERRVDWAGRYYLDATSPTAQDYLGRLFRMICDEWGYEYVKIDAQGGMAALYEAHRTRLADPSLNGERAYRLGLGVIKQVMGPKRFLLNCAHGFSSVGLCEGIRIGADVGLSWEGMQPAINSTLQWLFLNTLAFYTDPDVVCVREPLPLEQARLWASLVGLTGQLLMASDKMYELPEERVELLRRIYPVADIHPMEIYPLDLERRPGIFDVKISKPGVGSWDVVGLFNWGEEPKVLKLTPGRLGLPAGCYVAVDFWRKELLGVGEVFEMEVRPQACRVVSIWREEGRPQFVGTSRHITCGADDAVSVSWSDASQVLSGVAQVVGGDPYVVWAYVPKGWRVADSNVTMKGRLAELVLHRRRNGRVRWSMKFDRG